MNLTFISHHNCSRLILIMAGWGMDANPFNGITYPGYDICVAWDYTTEELNTTELSTYREIVVIAWSMGVMEATRILPTLHLPISLTIAVNGTMMPVSDEYGIPTTIFNDTLNNLSSDSIQRFNRRMCGTRDLLNKFITNAPDRTIQSLRDELYILGLRAGESLANAMAWDMAIISSRDLIFPLSNQLKAWDTIPHTIIEWSHLPDFNEIITRYVVNKEKVVHSFNRTAESYNTNASDQQQVAMHLVDNLSRFTGNNNHFDYAIEIGAGLGSLTSLYYNHYSFNRLELWDIATTSNSTYTNVFHVTDDAEARLFELQDNSIDLIISASTLQWFNSPITAIHNIQRTLKPGGIAAIALYTQGTYESFARATGISINYISSEKLVETITSPCTLLHKSDISSTQQFDSTLKLFNHMHDTGVNAAGAMPISTMRNILRNDSLRQLEYISTLIIIEKQ